MAPHHIELSSDAFFEAWDRGEERQGFFGEQVTLGGPIVFAFIDGDHRLEQVERDFENVHRHLAPGGFILFDDSPDWSDWDPNKTARRVAARPDYKLVRRGPNYLVQRKA